MTHIERIDDFIKCAGCVTKWDDHKLRIGNFNARMSEARKEYPIKRAIAKRKTPNEDGEKPIHYVYYYDKDRVVISDNEEIIRWIDEPDEQIS